MDVPAEREARAPGKGAVHAALLAVQAAFATLSIAGKVLLRTLDPSSLVLLRLAGAALVFGAIFARARLAGRAPAVPLRDGLAIAGCALLGMCLNQLLFLHGLRLTGPVDATLLVATIPVFTILFAVLLGRERASTRTLGGVALAFGGVLWLVGGEALGPASDRALGDLLVLLNSITYALYLVLVRPLAERHGSLAVVAIGFSAAALVALPIGAGSLGGVASLDPAGWALAVWVILVATVFTYLANAWALARTPSSTVAVYIYAQPTLAALMAWAWLGEVPGPRLYAAAAAIFAGIWLAARARS